MSSRSTEATRRLVATYLHDHRTSQRALAAKTGIAQSKISRLLNGQLRDLRADERERLVSVIDTNLGEAMTDRIRSLTIVLDRDMRTDDVQVVVDAIKMIKFVASVEEGPVTDLDAYLARASLASDLRRDLAECINNFFEKKRTEG